MDKVYDFLINKVKLNSTDIIVVGVSAGPEDTLEVEIREEPLRP